MNAKISVFVICVKAIIYIYIIRYIYIYIYISYYSNCMTVPLNRKGTYLISFFVLLDLNFNFWQKNL